MDALEKFVACGVCSSQELVLLLGLIHSVQVIPGQAAGRIAEQREYDSCRCRPTGAPDSRRRDHLASRVFSMGVTRRRAAARHEALKPGAEGG